MSTLLSVAESTRHDPELGMSWRNRHTLVNLQLIAEMQLQAGAEIGVLRAAVDFLGGVGLEGLT